jgi:hypothetical protein
MHERNGYIPEHIIATRMASGSPEWGTPSLAQVNEGQFNREAPKHTDGNSPPEFK